MLRVEKVKELADKKGLSLYQLMIRAEISQSYFYRLMRGEMTNPSINVLIKISSVLGCPIEDLIK